MTDDTSDFEAQLRSLLADGRKIEAIRLYRKQTGAGLAEAKEAVEALERGDARGAEGPADSELEPEIVSLLEQGRKIEAVKFYREKTGLGLKEAKDAVEAIAAKRGIAAPSGSGCLGVVLLVVVILLGCLGLL